MCKAVLLLLVTLCVAMAQERGPSPYCTTLPCSHACTAPHDTYPFCDTTRPMEKRADDFVRMLTLDEKIQLVGANPSLDKCAFVDQGVPRLGVPLFMWLVETNTGVASACIGPDQCATTFASPAGLAASFNRTAWRMKGSVISTEMRVLNNLGWYRAVDGLQETHYTIGLAGYGPNINIVRDPRFGRNSELPSEDPFLAGTYAQYYVKGMQEGEDPRYLKMMAFLKHYTAYSAEANRAAFNGVISAFDIWDTYLAQYEIAFREGKASGAMCSYASVNGVPSCANNFLLNDVMRTRWNRPDALITTDCGAIQNMVDANHYATSNEDAVAKALNGGTDLNTEYMYTNYLKSAIAKNLTSELYLNDAVHRSILLRMRAGMFDPLTDQVYTKYTAANFSSAANRQVNYDTVSQSFVLLKNDGVLPLRRGRNVAVVGPHAVSTRGLLEDYWGDNICYGGFYACIQTIGAAFQAENVGGTTTVLPGVGVTGSDASGIAAAVAAAGAADVVVLCLGLDTISVEHEGTDRTATTLPGIQEQFAQKILALNKPTVLILLNGGAVAFDNLVSGPNAIVEAFYPSTEGGKALARQIFGDFNKWGRLPYTIYPANYITHVSMNDMSMTNGAGRTYRYYTGTPLFEFGHGLSYSTNNLQWCRAGLDFRIDCSLCQPNSSRDGAEVLLVFHSVGSDVRHNATHPVPTRQLVEFGRWEIASAGNCRDVTFHLTREAFTLTNGNGDRVLYPGTHYIDIWNGGNQTARVTYQL